MGYLGTEIRDGALYTDITPEVLGLPPYTPLCGIPIEYKHAWEDFGEAFKAFATQTCPVDTGYLRDHIDFAADEGGVECWSDADYSAYQEYGTSRMRAQPYFEAALQTAWDATKDSFNAAINFYRDMDQDFAFLLKGCTGGIEECYHYLNVLGSWIPKCYEAGYDTTILEDAYEEVYARLLQMEQTEMMQQQNGLGFFGQLLAMMLASLIIAVLTFPFNMMWEDRGVEHNPSH